MTKMRSPAHTPAAAQVRLETTLLQLEQPFIRTVDQVSEIHSAIKGTTSQRKLHNSLTNCEEKPRG